MIETQVYVSLMKLDNTFFAKISCIFFITTSSLVKLSALHKFSWSYCT